MAYEYQKLNAVDIRLLTLWPGQPKDNLVTSLTHVVLEAPEEQVVSPQHSTVLSVVEL